MYGLPCLCSALCNYFVLYMYCLVHFLLCVNLLRVPVLCVCECVCVCSFGIVCFCVYFQFAVYFSVIVEQVVFYVCLLLCVFCALCALLCVFCFECVLYYVCLVLCLSRLYCAFDSIVLVARDVFVCIRWAVCFGGSTLCFTSVPCAGVMFSMSFALFVFLSICVGFSVYFLWCIFWPVFALL